MSKRQLFVFWQFGGDNHAWCNQKCGYYYKGEAYCYGSESKDMHSYWNKDPKKWTEAFERLDREHGNAGIYFVMSYGESLGMEGFYDCVDMIGNHPTWSLCIVTNLSLDPTRLVNTRLAKEGRLMMHPSWHPYGMPDRIKGWETFKKHLLILKSANVPIHVLYCWWPSQTNLFPEYFEWLDANGFRVNVRRFLRYSGYKVPLINKQLFAKYRLAKYSKPERDYIYANTCPKVTKYGLDLVSPKGRWCTASKDLILVKYNGDIAYCADLENTNIGNIFDTAFHLSNKPIKCQGCICGGDYGMLHIIDKDFPANPERLPNQPFLSIAENLPEGNPVPYPQREEMLRCLRAIKEQ